MKIEVKMKMQWGNKRYFPENKLATGILMLMGRKSFTDKQIRLLKI